MHFTRSMTSPARRADAGFSMIEMMLAALIFTIVSGAVLGLFASHLPRFNQQQNLAQVNIGLRNAVSQIQLDVANAGANYFPGANIPNYPIAVVITNNIPSSGTSCESGTPPVYSSTCFDSMAIVTADPNTPATDPQLSTGPGACISTYVSGGGNITVYLSPTGSTTGYGTTQSVATTASNHYLTGDQIMFVRNDGGTYTTAKLTAPGSTAKIGSNWYVTITFGSTLVDGSNTAGSTGNDPYGMTTHSNSLLSTSFGNGSTCGSVDYVLRLLPITYQVDLSTPSNPALLRIVAGNSQTVSQETIANQIIGFKIGASLFQSSTDTYVTTYCFNAQAYDPSCPTVSSGTNGAWAYNYTLVRSVMVSIIGRTNPNADPTYVFRNTFDSGPYQIQGISVVVNPRNMSMND